ncbi:hypothetical protein ACFXPS_30450 [Nocardia sp. NPDC059091]|uniref:hypothetical protein n=1 Tax=unclassified Nocardia TaxID=2637762 RepID=UPI0036A3A0EE
MVQLLIARETPVTGRIGYPGLAFGALQFDVVPPEFDCAVPSSMTAIPGIAETGSADIETLSV